VAFVRASGAVVMLVLGMFAAPLTTLAQGYNGMPLKQYEELVAANVATDPGAENTLNWYLDGVVVGLAWSFNDYWTASRAHFFCPSRELRLSHAEHLRAIIAAELAANGADWRRKPQTPIQDVAVQALKRNYPCPTR
jgi:hypothetical protein